ncbi:MAG: CinA family protein [Campylobacterota bacterium]|nr:CinA family protein [Campylobacterota bacterium]
MENLDNIIKKIIHKLNSQKQTISFAESCTGGRIAAAFTAIPGASSILNGSCVTYSNEIKHLWLGVEIKVLEEHGAVSSQCVSQMLEGILKFANSDCAIAVSGIAGPTGGSTFKPVGTVYIGLRTPQFKEVYHCNFSGSREAVQAQSTHYAIEKLGEILNI